MATALVGNAINGYLNVMRKDIALTIGNLILGYCLFTAGLFITSSLIFGGVVFDSIEAMKEPAARAVWYIDSIGCPITAVIIGLLAGCLPRNGAWKIAAISTAPMFAYLHLAKFPQMEVSVAGELIRGGRYVAIGVVTAPLVSGPRGRIMKRVGSEDYGSPPMPPAHWD